MSKLPAQCRPFFPEEIPNATADALDRFSLRRPEANQQRQSAALSCIDDRGQAARPTGADRVHFVPKAEQT